MWCVSASDSGGGAGAQADNAACRDLDTHPAHVITGITAQNSLGITHVAPVSSDVIAHQINALAADLPAAAIKIGALPGDDAIDALAPIWEMQCPVVIDPVMSATSGGALAGADFIESAIRLLLPHASLVTPNLPECEAFIGRPVRQVADMPAAATWFRERGAKAVVIKGGHLADSCVDYFDDGDRTFYLRHPRVDTPHHHGTGCTFSSAAAAALALGESLADAVILAKMLVTQGLQQSYPAGAGSGPLGHAGWPSSTECLPGLYYAEPPTTVNERFPDCGTKELGLYACVDSADWIEQLLPLGVRTLQLRNKSLRGAALRAEIERAHVMCLNAGARLFINDYWREAIEVGAYGVHLGQEDLFEADTEQIRRAGLRLGISTHAWYELARAHALRPSYLAFGPVYATTTKPMAFAPQGLERLGRWSRLSADYPQVAIGGIDASRVAGCLEQGVGSVCVVRAITEAPDVAAATTELDALVRAGQRRESMSLGTD